MVITVTTTSTKLKALMSNTQRKQAALNTLKTIGGIAAVLTLANAVAPGSVETDPRTEKMANPIA